MSYGYTGHVMDFPGTINGHFEHFMHLMLGHHEVVAVDDGYLAA